jgi:DNA modification methylase
VSGLGRANHKEFMQASGEMSQQEFRAFLKQNSTLLRRWSQDGSLHYICMDWRHIHDLVEAAGDVYSELKNICVWVKTNAGMGSLYRSQHEMVAVFKAGTASHTNNVELGRHGRYRTNVWEYCGMNSFQNDRDAKLAMHPTVKPTAMVADAIFDCTRRGDIVLDPFGGSGTTLLAAQRAGRVARLIELDPAYIDVTLARFHAMTGQCAYNLWTGAHYPAPAATVSASTLENVGV